MDTNSFNRDVLSNNDSNIIILDSDNALFYSIYENGGEWKIHFTKNIHGEENTKHDDKINSLMNSGFLAKDTAEFAIKTLRMEIDAS